MTTMTEHISPLNLTRTPPCGDASHLFNARDRPTAFRALPEAKDDLIRLNLPFIKRRWAMDHGAQKDESGFLCINRNTDLDAFEKHLPFYARTQIIPMNIAPIPASSFGGSLSNLLTANSWKDVKNIAIKSTCETCRVCGGLGRGKYIEAHEIWDYHYKSLHEPGLQRLAGIIPLCRDCHAIFHPGFAEIQGRLKTVLERTAWANRWSMAETRSHHNMAMKLWQKRSTLSWHLDLSAISSKPDLVLKPGLKVSSSGEIAYKDSSGRKGLTRILGMRYAQRRGLSQKSGSPSYEGFKPIV